MQKWLVHFSSELGGSSEELQDHMTHISPLRSFDFYPFCTLKMATEDTFKPKTRRCASWLVSVSGMNMRPIRHLSWQQWKKMSKHPAVRGNGSLKKDPDAEWTENIQPKTTCATCISNVKQYDRSPRRLLVYPHRCAYRCCSTTRQSEVTLPPPAWLEDSPVSLSPTPGSAWLSWTPPSVHHRQPSARSLHGNISQPARTRTNTDPRLNTEASF